MTPPDPTPTVTINLADADGDPVDSSYTYTGSVNEDGTSPDLPRVRASVDNAPQTSIIEYGFLESGGGRLTTSEGGVFQINSSTGAISVADSSLLDYETTPRYELTASVLYDADGDPRTTTDEVTREVQVVIDVGDVLIELADADGNPVSSYTGSVDEDGGNADLPTISASVGNVAQGSIIEYAFLESGGGRNAISEGGVGAFRINTSTGAISVADSSLLDYEATPRYELTVSVLYDPDNDPRTPTGEVTRDVQVVIDVNDVAGQSPAIIPDRQSFAHQDPYDPDDLGLTPMPDADPSAG